MPIWTNHQESLFTVVLILGNADRMPPCVLDIRIIHPMFMG